MSSCVTHAALETAHLRSLYLYVSVPCRARFGRFPGRTFFKALLFPDHFQISAKAFCHVFKLAQIYTGARAPHTADRCAVKMQACRNEWQSCIAQKRASQHQARFLAVWGDTEGGDAMRGGGRAGSNALFKS